MNEGMRFTVEPSPEDFRKLPIHERWAIKNGLVETLNDVLPQVEAYRDLDRMLQVARDYGLYLEHKGTGVRLKLLVVPAWLERGLTWEDAVEQSLNTDEWPDAQYYTDADALCSAVPIADLHKFFRFL